MGGEVAWIAEGLGLLIKRLALCCTCGAANSPGATMFSFRHRDVRSRYVRAILALEIPYWCVLDIQSRNGLTEHHRKCIRQFLRWPPRLLADLDNLDIRIGTGTMVFSFA